MKCKLSWLRTAFWATSFFIILSVQNSESQALGPFEEHGDIGTVLHPGSSSFDAGTGTYTLTGSGENMWATADAFQFLWKKVSGDITLSADIAFPTATGNPHKKAVLMIRQSLDADSAYVDAALHVAGLTSLQSRAEKGGATHEVGIDGEAAVQLRLEKRGSYFYMYVARKGEKLHLGGGSMRLELKEPFYIGLGVCAHDKDAVETATFSNVTIGTPAKGKLKLYSTLETISVSSTDQRVVAVFNERVEEPRWTADGANLVFKKGKGSAQIPATGGKEEPSSAIAKKPNKSDKPSPDGQKQAKLSYWGKKPMDATLSVKTVSDGTTKVLAPLSAGQGTLSDAPWSPDGKRLVFVSYQLVPQD
jgi:TolB protein